MAQWLTAPAVLSEDPNSVPSTYIGSSQTLTPVPGKPDTFTQIYMHAKKKKKKTQWPLKKKSLRKDFLVFATVVKNPT